MVQHHSDFNLTLQSVRLPMTLNALKDGGDRGLLVTFPSAVQYTSSVTSDFCGAVIILTSPLAEHFYAAVEDLSAMTFKIYFYKTLICAKHAYFTLP